MFGRKRKQAMAVVHDYVDALNARDADRMKHLLHPECRFVDSHGFCLDGYEDSAAAVDAFLDLDDQFKVHLASMTMRGSSILMRGHTEARDERLARDTLWTAKVKDGKLLFWQSFGDVDAPAIAHLIAPEKARHVG